MDGATYAIVCCHQGAELPLKKAAELQGWRLAFSRPGLVTFKHASASNSVRLPADVFARTASWSLGRVSAGHTSELAEAIINIAKETKPDTTFQGLHVWSRDRLPVGERGYEPEIELLSEAVSEELEAQLCGAGLVTSSPANSLLQIGDKCLDCVMVDPGSWLVGWHEGTRFAPTCWPGGFPPVDPEHEVVSRAYFKAAEALMWSGLPVRPGDIAVEIGSAPGGAAQRLLELGLRVIGIDPAEMDPGIASHPNFRHVRARGGDIKRSEYKDASWLLVDSNVRPDKTMVTVENIVTNRQVSIRGMILTMKLGSYTAAHRIPGWCQKIVSWGFSRVDVRQLATGRCEVCIAAQRT